MQFLEWLAAFHCFHHRHLDREGYCSTRARASRFRARAQFYTLLTRASRIMASNSSESSSNLAVVESSPLRRRSVHFDSSPTEIVGGAAGKQDVSKAFTRRQAEGAVDGIREEEDEPGDGEERPPSSSPPPASSFDPKLALRRQSAPAAAIALGAASAPPGAVTGDEVLTKMGKEDLLVRTLKATSNHGAVFLLFVTTFCRPQIHGCSKYSFTAPVCTPRNSNHCPLW